MLGKLKALFQPEHADLGTDESRMRLACAALMMEVATIDDNFSTEESEKLLDVLTRRFNVDTTELQTLRDSAGTARENATSLHEFTSEINHLCSAEQKYRLVEGMWQVAYADGHLDKYEEHIVRRVADLIYLSHSDFIRAKISARDNI